MTAKANCSPEEFKVKLKQLEFLGKRLESLKKKSPLEVASKEEIAQIREAIANYSSHEEGRMKC